MGRQPSGTPLPAMLVPGPPARAPCKPAPSGRRQVAADSGRTSRASGSAAIRSARTAARRRAGSYIRRNRRSAVEGEEAVRDAGAGGVPSGGRIGGDHVPARAAVGRERVAADVEVELGDDEAVGDIDRAGEQLGPADDPDPVVGVGCPRARAPRRPSRRARRRRPSNRHLPVTTMFARPGSGRNRGGRDSHVRRPITTGAPPVVRLKCARSSGTCHGMPPLRADHAAVRLGPDEADARRADVVGRRRRHPSSPRRSYGDGRADRRVVLVADHLEVLVPVVEDRVGRRAMRSVGYGNGSRSSCSVTCSTWLS